MDSWWFDLAFFILVFPLVSFLINGLYLGSRNWKAAGVVAIVGSGFTVVWAIGIAYAYFSSANGQGPSGVLGPLIPWEFSWLSFSNQAESAGGLIAKIGVYLDPITVMMLVVIGVISFLVNIYSFGYMKHDPAAGRFFALLSLFSFSMLGLVVATNLFQMFVFWELVGVSSYLLIGFWYEKPAAINACKKAFIVTRFADAFFLLGIILISYHTQSFDFMVLNRAETAQLLNKTIHIGWLPLNLLTVSTMLIFVGGWGKSAMFPLHVWLPDAMEGPTPVSAIIHSATMVVAGVFLTARMFPLFSMADFTLPIIGGVGAFTALFAAVIACIQTDIKRILAFSTLSQLGYMMFSLGTSQQVNGQGLAINTLGYTASMFHIFTHAFFKCLLFLAAGAIIHVVHSNDLRKMGGLRKQMPFTYVATFIACLAIAGVFPFSGFYSKDEIILTALMNGHYFTFTVGLLVGGITAFYMFRFFFLIFHGIPHSDVTHREDWFMTLPIVILAIPSAISGFLAKSFFMQKVIPLTFLPKVADGSHMTWLPVLATAVGLTGIFCAYWLFGKKKYAEDHLRCFVKPTIYQTIVNKFYIDDFYLFVTHRVIFDRIAGPAKWFDRNIVDGSINLVGACFQFGGILVRLTQNGYVQFYLFIMLMGLLGIYIGS